MLVVESFFIFPKEQRTDGKRRKGGLVAGHGQWLIVPPFGDELFRAGVERFICLR